MTTIQLCFLIAASIWFAMATATLASEAKRPWSRIGWFMSGLAVGGPCVALLGIYFSAAP